MSSAADWKSLNRNLAPSSCFPLVLRVAWPNRASCRLLRRQTLWRDKTLRTAIKCPIHFSCIFLWATSLLLRRHDQRRSCYLPSEQHGIEASGRRDNAERRVSSHRLHDVRLLHLQLAGRALQTLPHLVVADDGRRQSLVLPLDSHIAARTGLTGHLDSLRRAPSTVRRRRSATLCVLCCGPTIHFLYDLAIRCGHFHYHHDDATRFCYPPLLHYLRSSGDGSRPTGCLHCLRGNLSENLLQRKTKASSQISPSWTANETVSCFVIISTWPNRTSDIIVVVSCLSLPSLPFSLSLSLSSLSLLPLMFLNFSTSSLCIYFWFIFFFYCLCMSIVCASIFVSH